MFYCLLSLRNRCIIHNRANISRAHTAANSPALSRASSMDKKTNEDNNNANISTNSTMLPLPSNKRPSSSFNRNTSVESNTSDTSTASHPNINSTNHHHNNNNATKRDSLGLPPLVPHHSG